MDWLKVTLILVALIGIIFFVNFAFSVRIAKVPSFDSPSPARLALNNLSREQKIGQRFVIGFQGTSVTPALERKIKNLHPGGILLLGRNIEDEEQLKVLVDEMQEIALKDTGLPLLVAVDQEGKPLCRIDWLECASLSDIKKEERAFEVGLERGKELEKLGVNLNLAPVLDKSYLGDFVYPRSFQAENAGFLAKSFISGQQENVFSVLKHFPGYTSIDFDPEREKLARLDFIPDISRFEIAMNSDPAMVMTSNAIYSELSDLPLSLSPEGIEFLREELNPGLVISDDLSSPVLKEEYGLEKTVSKAAEAGVDVLLVAGFENPEDPKRAVNHLREEVATKGNESLLKIIKLKRKLHGEGY